MEVKKCLQCGGNLTRLPMQNAWICSYCDTRYEDETTQEEAIPASYYGLNPKIFDVKKDLAKMMKESGGAGCIASIVHCLETFSSEKELEEYMRNRIPFSDDISMKGVREECITAAMPVIESVMEPGERVIVYGNKGIFSKGKEFFVITDKQSIFVKKKDIKAIKHQDIDSLQFQSCGNCFINGGNDTGIINLDGNGTYQGAVIALICMRSFTEDANRSRIQII